MRSRHIKPVLGIAGSTRTATKADWPALTGGASMPFLTTDRGNDTRLTRVLSGRPARGISNRFIVECEVPGSPVPAAYPYAYDAAKQLHAAAESRGNTEFGAYWAGQGARRARTMPAGELVKVLAAEMRQVRRD